MTVTAYNLLTCTISVKSGQLFQLMSPQVHPNTFSAWEPLKLTVEIRCACYACYCLYIASYIVIYHYLCIEKQSLTRILQKLKAICKNSGKVGMDYPIPKHKFCTQVKETEMTQLQKQPSCFCSDPSDNLKLGSFGSLCNRQ